MGTEEEIQRLVLQVEGEERLRQLNQELKNELKLVDELKALFAGMPNQQAVFAQQMDISAEKVKALGTQIVGLTAELDKMEEAGGGFRLRGGMRADLILTHAFRELMSETASLTEKIERLGMVAPYVLNMFGVGGPWLLGITLGVTAVAELTTHWKELLKWLGDPAPLEAAKMIEEMTKRSTEAVEEFKKNVGIPSEAEAGIMAVFKKMTQGPQGRAIQDEVIAAMIATGTGEARQAAGQAGGERAPVGSLAHNLWLQAQQVEDERVRLANLAKAQALLGGAAAGKTPQERLEAQTMLRGLLPKRFGDLSVEDQEAQGAASDAAHDQFEEGNLAWRRRKEALAKARKERAQQQENTAQMDEMGKRHAAQMKKQHEHEVDQHLRKSAQEAKREPMERATNRMAMVNSRMGLGMTEAQVHDSAEEMLRLSRAGYNLNIATQGGIEKTMMEAQKLRAQIEATTARLHGNFNGPDQSGDFSRIAPGW